MARRIWTSPLYVVSMMTRASGNSPRIAISESRPFICGICRSMRVMSGRCVRNCWIASRPLEASATTLMSGCVAKSAAMPLRNRGWSSTDRIRIGLDSLLMLSSGASFRRYRLAHRRRFCISEGTGYRQFDLGAGFDFAPDSQFSSHKFRALVHTRQAVMPAASLASQYLSVDTLSVVAHAQPELPAVIADLHF